MHTHCAMNAVATAVRVRRPKRASGTKRAMSGGIEASSYEQY